MNVSRCAGTWAGCTLTAMMIEIGGFLALAALIIGLFAWLKADISSLRRETHRAFGELRRDMRQAISGRSAA